jgi:hypothetical protein
MFNAFVMTSPEVPVPPKIVMMVLLLAQLPVALTHSTRSGDTHVSIHVQLKSLKD